MHLPADVVSLVPAATKITVRYDIIKFKPQTPMSTHPQRAAAHEQLGGSLGRVWRSGGRLCPQKWLPNLGLLLLWMVADAWPAAAGLGSAAAEAGPLGYTNARDRQAAGVPCRASTAAATASALLSIALSRNHPPASCSTNRLRTCKQEGSITMLGGVSIMKEKGNKRTQQVGSASGSAFWG